MRTCRRLAISSGSFREKNQRSTFGIENRVYARIHEQEKTYLAIRMEIKIIKTKTTLDEQRKSNRWRK